MKTLTPVQQRARAELGLLHLRVALSYFKESNNPNTVDRVRLAISSAKGAVRICGYRVARPDRRAPRPRRNRK